MNTKLEYKNRNVSIVANQQIKKMNEWLLNIMQFHHEAV